MQNEFKSLVHDIAKVSDAQMTLDLHLKSLEMTLYHMFDDSDCEQYQSVAEEIEAFRRMLHLRLLSITHCASFAALKSDEVQSDLSGLAAREAQ
jgi:hypothetical protein